MSEQRCENSRADPCPRVDTTPFEISIGGQRVAPIWLCPEHTQPEWAAAAPSTGEE